MSEQRQWGVMASDCKTARGLCMKRGVEVYRHPSNCFVVLEFQCKHGKYREAFYPNELKAV